MDQEPEIEQLPPEVAKLVITLKGTRNVNLGVVLAVLRDHGWTSETLADTLGLSSNYVQSIVRTGRSRIIGKDAAWVSGLLSAVGLDVVPMANTPPKKTGVTVAAVRTKMVSPYAFLSRQEVEDLRTLYRNLMRNQADPERQVAFLAEIGKLQRQYKVPGPCLDIAIGRPFGWCARMSIRINQTLGFSTNK